MFRGLGRSGSPVWNVISKRSTSARTRSSSARVILATAFTSWLAGVW